MEIPNWYEAVLLALAAWRTFQLIAYDDLLDRPRNWVMGLPRGATSREGGREWLMDFIECPYCAGFWMTAAWWGAWQAWPHETLVVGALFALHAGMIGAHKLISSE